MSVDLLDNHKRFIAAARDFANAGKSKFDPRYDQYVDLLEAAETVVAALSPRPASDVEAIKPEWTPWEGGERPKPDSAGLIVYEPTEANTLFRADKFTSVIPVYFDEEGRICDYGTSKPEIGISSGYWRATHWMPFPERPQP